jgi:putative ABC transport system permease protein
VGLISGLRARLRALLRRTAADRELSEEIRFHIDLETEKNIKLGLPPDEARRVAMSHFGGVQRVREEHRDVRRLQWIEDFVGDARFAFRSLRRTPGLAGTAVLTLALGIGANVAIFSAVNAVVLQPLPFPSPGRLVVITEENPEKHWHLNIAAPANYLDWRDGVSDFTDAMGYYDGVGQTTMTGRGEPRLLASVTSTGSFFNVLGVRAAIGRTFTDEETWRSGTHVAVLSDRAWREQFGADPSIVGQTITLNGATTQVIGVMPSGFSYPREGVDVWRTMEWDAARRGEVSFRRAHSIRVVARLKPGATLEHADAQLQTVVNRLKHDYPATNKVMGAMMLPLHQFLVGDTRLPLLVLLASVGLLLLIACANVGNLLLVQAAARERETSLRLALGAGRSRLVRQAFAESLVLATLGAALGLGTGWMGTRWLVRLQPPRMLRVHDFGVDTTVVIYVAVLAVVSALAFGVAPALATHHRDPAESLKDGGRGAMPGHRARRWSNVLASGEVALALLMAVGAGLLVRSLWRLRDVDPGFDGRGVLTALVVLPAKYDSVPAVEAFMNQLVARSRALPGVNAVATTTSLSLTGPSWTSDYTAAGRPADGYGTEVSHRVVSPDYFTTMKVPVLRGRAFTAEARRGTPLVVMINEALARSYFPGQDPIGQRIAFAKVPQPNADWYTIVGVTGNEHVESLDLSPRPEVYQSSVQEPQDYQYLLVRSAADPSTLTTGLRGVLRELDPTLVLRQVQTMDAVREASLARAVFLTTLLLMFAVIGLVLSVVGVYGVLAHIARNRTREMGIRIALGAQAGQVRWLVVRHGLRLTIGGLLVGGVTALLATRAMRNMLFGVAPNDPLTLAGVVLILSATSVVASWIPAIRASRADPAVALRAD